MYNLLYKEIDTDELKNRIEDVFNSTIPEDKKRILLEMDDKIYKENSRRYKKRIPVAHSEYIRETEEKSRRYNEALKGVGINN